MLFNKLLRDNTSARIGAWKCNFPALILVMMKRLTNILTNRPLLPNTLDVWSE